MKNVFQIFLILLLLVFNVSYAAKNPVDIQLSTIERSIWGFEYKNDDTSKRLSRIEKNIFGTLNEKLTDEQRIKKINTSMGFESYEDSKKPIYEIDQTEVSGINYPQMDLIEYQIFKETYQNENIYKRLDRVENKIFGSVQEGNLISRVDRLKSYTKKDTAPKNPSYYIQPTYTTTQDVEQYMNSQDKYTSSDIYIQLSGLETLLFSKSYSQDPVGLRLNRLERKIFQRDFSSDDEYLRIQRLQAAAGAQRTAKLYEANKIQKYTSTGMQIGSLILMILAFIL